MQHAEIIRRLGGPTKLAQDLGLSVLTSVGHWPARGIPARYWHRVVQIAEQRGVAVSFSDLERRDNAA